MAKRAAPEKSRVLVKLILLLTAGLFLIPAFFPSAVQTALDSLQTTLHRIDRKLYYTFGWPLRGTPDLARFEERLKEKDLALGSPLFIRIFKQEHELEIWMRRGQSFELFASYPVCTYSGELGPKLKQGDKQAPEGFYTVSRGQMNPNSRWHRSFNLGYPNAFDASHGRTGDFLMVHGGCSSIGCYAMTNRVIDEVWALMTAAFDKGQQRIGVQVFPFRMTDLRLAAHTDNPWAGFWRDLKQGYDLFEKSRVPPQVSVCQKRYVAAPGKPEAVDAPLIKQDCPGEASLQRG